MCIDSQLNTANPFAEYSQLPQPGEIWEVSRSVRHPLMGSTEEMAQLYSETARQFLTGQQSPRYVAIVREAKSTLPDKALEEKEAAIVSVMVLSEKTQFLSDVDVLIPSDISGLDRDLLAQTWHVLPMLSSQLFRPVGRRLSRKVYDILLDVGDAALGLLPIAPSPESVSFLGLKIGTARSPEIKAFHQQEREWSDVLSVPLTVYRHDRKTMALATRIADAALEVERELVTSSESEVNLSRWLQNLFDLNWLSWTNFWEMPEVHFAGSTRSTADSSENDSEHLGEIQTLIERFATETDEHQKRAVAKKLGELASANPDAIAALVRCVQTTQNDETLWTAVESLWRIDPENSAAGTRRVKLIDWGLDVSGNAVALAVAVVPKSRDRLSVLLRIYPAGDRPYLPSHLKLILLDETGRALREVTAREADIFLQLKLSGKPEEKFSVRVALGNASITEDFTL